MKKEEPIIQKGYEKKTSDEKIGIPKTQGAKKKRPLIKKRHLKCKRLKKDIQ
jgi:hypothetical protein